MGVWAMGPDTVEGSRENQNIGVGVTASAAMFASKIESGTDIYPQFFDGVAWSLGSAQTNISRTGHACAGTPTAGLIFKGWDGYSTANRPSESEEYDGSAWSISSDVIRPLDKAAGSGSQVSALAPEQSYDYVDVEIYDGAAWSRTTEMPVARLDTAVIGESAESILHGGGHYRERDNWWENYQYYRSNENHVFDGVAWEQKGDAPYALRHSTATGSWTLALCAGGYRQSFSSDPTNEAWEYIGGVCSVAANMTYARWSPSSFGTLIDGWVTGTSDDTDSTENYTRSSIIVLEKIAAILAESVAPEAYIGLGPWTGAARAISLLPAEIDLLRTYSLGLASLAGQTVTPVPTPPDLVSVPWPGEDMFHMGDWRREDFSGENLSDSINEINLDANDYIFTPDDTFPAVYVMSVAFEKPPESREGHRISVSYGAWGDASALDFTFELRQGYRDETIQGTLIFSWQNLGVTDLQVNDNKTLSVAQAEAITDYRDLVLRIVVDVAGA